MHEIVGMRLCFGLKVKNGETAPRSRKMEIWRHPFYRVMPTFKELITMVTSQPERHRLPRRPDLYEMAALVVVLLALYLLGPSYHDFWVAADQKLAGGRVHTAGKESERGQGEPSNLS
jgi:hypothetical protein